MTDIRPLRAPEEIWRAYDATEARLTAPVSERMVELAGLRPGMRVLDLAAGRGEPAILAARRVGPTGSVVGVDISAGMLEMARERAAREGVTNLELLVGNAELFESIPPAQFDAVLVRWGLMYMDSPVAALAAARRALMPHGRIVAALWAEPERVSYFTLPRRVLERYRPSPPIDFDAPGTFRYADPDRIRGDFARGGLVVDQLEELDLPVMEAATGPELIAWVRAFGLTRFLNGLPEDVQRAWETDMIAAAEPFRRGGLFQLGGVTRIVVASSAERRSTQCIAAR